MSSFPDSATTPDGHFLVLEPDGNGVSFRKDAVENVAVLRPAERQPGRTDGQVEWELAFETAYYHPSVTLAGDADRAPVEAALLYLDQAIEDA